jgi:hypothetical protein
MLNGGSDVVFGPEEIGAMRQALGKACQALNFAFSDGIDTSTRLELARSILKHAAEGELRALNLCALALRDLAPKAASYVRPRVTDRTRRLRSVSPDVVAQADHPGTSARYELYLQKVLS